MSMHVTSDSGSADSGSALVRFIQFALLGGVALLLIGLFVRAFQGQADQAAIQRAWVEPAALNQLVAQQQAQLASPRWVNKEQQLIAVPIHAAMTAAVADIKTGGSGLGTLPTFNPYEGKTPVEIGQLAYTKLGCMACHSTDGSGQEAGKVGPTLKALFGKTHKVTTDGKEREITVDEEFLKKSILTPLADIYVGFAPAMPPFAGVAKDEELAGLVALIKSLK
ncbi:MAG: cytochrome c [Deltaproteobacteria bacterium]|nr:cytochrome c [Deltaproteobacteria bacterium]